MKIISNISFGLTTILNVLMFVTILLGYFTLGPSGIAQLISEPVSNYNLAVLESLAVLTLVITVGLCIFKSGAFLLFGQIANSKTGYWVVFCISILQLAIFIFLLQPLLYIGFFSVMSGLFNKG